MRKRTPEAVDTMPFEGLLQLGADCSLEQIIAIVRERIGYDQDYLQSRNRRLAETTPTDRRLRRELPMLARVTQLLEQFAATSSS